MSSRISFFKNKTYEEIYGEKAKEVKNKLIESWKTRKVPREIRSCSCGCEQTFECKVTSKKRFILGHKFSMKEKRNIKKEVRFCKCGCGESFECKENSIKRFIQGHNRKNKKCTLEHRKNVSKALGEKLGWVSLEPYGKEFNRFFKEEIRKRDHYRCQECFRYQDELFTKSGKHYKLNIHHIDYNKKNNNSDNLISLCRSCHMQTNYDRKDWIEYYKDKLR